MSLKQLILDMTPEERSKAKAMIEEIEASSIVSEPAKIEISERSEEIDSAESAKKKAK